MPKQHTLLASFCLAACAAPLLGLLAPGSAAVFAPDPASQARWMLGLDLGLAVLALLAWRVNQVRLSAIAAGLAASAAFTVHAPAAGFTPLAVANGWLVAVPSGIALSLLPKEGALLSQRTLARLALLCLPALLAWAVAASDPADCARILAWSPWGAPKPGLPGLLAHLSLALFGSALLLRLHSRIETPLVALGGGLLGITGLAWGAVLAGADPGALARLWLAGHLALAACLATGLSLLYWQRVYLDELTGVPNRRALDEILAHQQGAFCLAMVDIDHFKKFNDTYGHAQGDDVLRMVAHHLRDSTAGRAYRYGGEEFCVLAPELDSTALEALMDASRGSLAARRFHVRLPEKERRRRSPQDRGKAHAPGVEVQVTVSVGVACRDRRRDSPAKVLKLADDGLYEAKAKGRNLVVKKN